MTWGQAFDEAMRPTAPVTGMDVALAMRSILRERSRK